jgi:hypothetical protein
VSASLFDEYPAVPLVPKHETCCAGWDEFERQHHPADRSCRVVHKLGHSRTPFTPAKVAELTGCTLYGAQLVIADACDRRWVYNISLHDEPDLYVGML